MANKIILGEVIQADGIPQKTAIRNALEAQLSKITKANGFYQDITIFDYRKRHYDGVDQQYPYIHVVPSDIQIKDAETDVILIENEFTLVCVVQTDLKDDSIDQLEMLEEDVLRCLLPKKGGFQSGAYNTLNGQITSIRYDLRDDGVMESSINITVSFNTTIQKTKEIK